MSHAMINATLVDIYGQPVGIDTAATLRAMGLRRDLHPRDAYAVRYESLEAAEAFAEANREYYGHEVYGPLETEVGPVNLLDLRPSIRRMGGKPVDPTLPDNAKH